MKVKSVFKLSIVFGVCLLLGGALLGGCQRGAQGRAGEESLQHGIPAPNFTLRDLNGAEKTLESYKGKLLLLNFWATWCAPCIAEMPSLERLYQTYKDRGLMIAAITIDPEDSKPEIEKFVKENGLSFDILFDPEISMPPSYGVTGFPETFFIAPDSVFLMFLDPVSKNHSVRVISDRAWDSPVFLKAIGSLLDKSRNDSNSN